MSRDAAVVNDVRVDGVTLLTGPNMAGKSTILRVAASRAPRLVRLTRPGASRRGAPFRLARRAHVLHGLPAEGLSSYAVEMAEVGQMLDVVTPRSLVFIDELGRGTEASHEPRWRAR